MSKREFYVLTATVYLTPHLSELVGIIFFVACMFVALLSRDNK